MKYVLTFVAVSCCISLSAQVAINTDGSSASASAMLHIKSTDKGLLIPSMTSAQRAAISSPSDGLIVYDTDTKTIWSYNITTASWKEVINSSLLSNPATDNFFVGNNSGIVNLV